MSVRDKKGQFVKGMTSWNKGMSSMSVEQKKPKRFLRSSINRYQRNLRKISIEFNYMSPSFFHLALIQSSYDVIQDEITVFRVDKRNEYQENFQKEYRLSGRRKVTNQKYEFSPKGKQTRRDFEMLNKLRGTRQIINDRYEKSSKAKKTRKKYNVYYSIQNPDIKAKCMNQMRISNRVKLIELLGGAKCVKCGYDSDIRGIQVDHKMGGGSQDAKEKGRGWHKYYLDHPLEAFWKLQVLCANCNKIKMDECHEYSHIHTRISVSDQLALIHKRNDIVMSSRV